jgi:hypothetical protein
VAVLDTYLDVWMSGCLANRLTLGGEEVLFEAGGSGWGLSLSYASGNRVILRACAQNRVVGLCLAFRSTSCLVFCTRA